jgi:uncharacterized protein YcgI (DUF1989 family)
MPRIPVCFSATQSLRAGQAIKTTNTSGGQLIDTWTFTHESHAQHAPEFEIDVGNSYLDNHRNPIRTITKDTSQGDHDVLYAACSLERYVQLCASTDHDNCAADLRFAVEKAEDSSIRRLKELLEANWLPDPRNSFMQVSVKDDGVPCEDPMDKPGDFVVLRAEQDCVAVFSACPMDVHTCNGGGLTSAEFEISE